ncbi:MAG: hypothetical protein J5965_01115, partial [Aeriscardovia sp.]|nr:hypothetical protein [Aeriscardovia sp.]
QTQLRLKIILPSIRSERKAKMGTCEASKGVGAAERSSETFHTTQKYQYFWGPDTCDAEFFIRLSLEAKVKNGGYYV